MFRHLQPQTNNTNKTKGCVVDVNVFDVHPPAGCLEMGVAILFLSVQVLNPESWHGTKKTLVQREQHFYLILIVLLKNPTHYFLMVRQSGVLLFLMGIGLGFLFFELYFPVLQVCPEANRPSESDPSWITIIYIHIVSICQRQLHEANTKLLEPNRKTLWALCFYKRVMDGASLHVKHVRQRIVKHPHSKLHELLASHQTFQAWFHPNGITRPLKQSPALAWQVL